MPRKDPSAVKEILFATDFSEESQAAGELAAAMARAFKARLHILHSAPVREASAEARLKKVAALLKGPAEVETAFEVGTPTMRIVHYAENHGIDLIVVGTHGRTGFSRALLGSVAERVARYAPCPVLTVPPAARFKRAEKKAAGADAQIAGRCIVCGKPSDDLICPACRDRIRAEAVEKKFGDETTRAKI